MRDPLHGASFPLLLLDDFGEIVGGRGVGRGCVTMVLVGARQETHPKMTGTEGSSPSTTT